LVDQHCPQAPPLRFDGTGETRGTRADHHHIETHRAVSPCRGLLLHLDLLRAHSYSLRDAPGSFSESLWTSHIRSGPGRLDTALSVPSAKSLAAGRTALPARCWTSPSAASHGRRVGATSRQSHSPTGVPYRTSGASERPTWRRGSHMPHLLVRAAHQQCRSRGRPPPPDIRYPSLHSTASPAAAIPHRKIGFLLHTWNQMPEEHPAERADAPLGRPLH